MTGSVLGAHRPEVSDVSDAILVQLDAVAALAGLLAALGAELADEAELCLSCAASLGASLDGGPGELAEQAGRGWAAVVGLLGDRATSVAQTLGDAVAGYRAVDAAAGELVSGRPGYAAVAV